MQTGEDILYIASFDIGKVNFAYCIERCSINGCKVNKKETTIEEMCSNGIIDAIDNVRLVSVTKKLVMRKKELKTYKSSGKYTFESLLFFLEKRKELWNKCHIFIIEQQMSQNKEGLKISFHLEAYFKTCYGTFKEIVMFPSYHKTQVFESEEWERTDPSTRRKEKYQQLSYSKRKKACVDKALEILKNRNDQDTIWKLERSQKRDDMCDVICQLQAYKWLYLMV